MLGSEAAAAAESTTDLEGLVVDVEITSWPTPTRPPVGRVIEVLGRSRRLRRRCGDDDPQAPAAAHLSGEGAGRGAQRGASRPGRSCKPPAIFADLPIVTIDGETARDFDDAVLVTRARRRRLRAAGSHCRCGRVCARRNRPRSRGAAARHQRLLSRSRHSHAAAGALDRHLQPAPRRRPAGAELHHAARCRWAASRATRLSRA